ncbi:MAG: serine hydrolase domain-containing protein [Thermoguttaceae bacterium]|jgi:CubicO group peptidase (beta-lactamase class C family)
MPMYRIDWGLAAVCMACCFFPEAAGGANAGGPAEGAPARAGGKSAELFADVRSKIKQEMADSNIPSLAVAVAKNGEILWEEAFGWADVQRRVPATVHTMYSLASVSKPITATGLMVLVEQGKLDLDAPANRYLAPDGGIKVWIGDPEEVTLRRVANHTAGLGRHEHFYRADEFSSKPPMEESIRRYGNIVTLPGERYRYSNFAYGILDHLLARTSGMTYGEFLRREVFLPLGMTRSAVDIRPELAELVAVRYDDPETPIPPYTTDHAGASAVYASVHDLVRFGMFHLGQIGPDQKAILSASARAAMQAPTASLAPVNLADVNLSSGSCYGIGWVIDDDDLGKRISHGGGMGGAAAKILMLPGEGIVIAAAANKFCRLPWEIEGDILSALIPGYAEKLAAERKKRREAMAASEKKEYAPVSELVGDWEGAVRTYAGDFPMTLSFKKSGDIHARLGDQLPVLVVNASFSNGRFSGSMAGRLDTGDANRRPWRPQHHLDLDLRLRGSVLNGAIIAIAGNSLSHWCELRKKAASADTERTGPDGSPRAGGKP